MFVCCESCVLSGRGLCDGPITRPEESYRLWCVAVCDLETSSMRRPWQALGLSAIEKKYIYIYLDVWLCSWRNPIKLIMCLNSPSPARPSPFSRTKPPPSICLNRLVRKHSAGLLNKIRLDTTKIEYKWACQKCWRVLGTLTGTVKFGFDNAFTLTLLRQ